MLKRKVLCTTDASGRYHSEVNLYKGYWSQEAHGNVEITEGVSVLHVGGSYQAVRGDSLLSEGTHYWEIYVNHLTGTAKYCRGRPW